MKRSTAERLGQKIVGKMVSSSIVGVKPLLMGIGPWKAVPVALEKAGISKDDVDGMFALLSAQAAIHA